MSGLGLGLLIVRALTENTGGPLITAACSAGRGHGRKLSSTVRTCPIAPVEAGGPASPPTRGSVAGSLRRRGFCAWRTMVSHPSRHRILIVDDNEERRPWILRRDALSFPSVHERGRCAHDGPSCACAPASKHKAP